MRREFHVRFCEGVGGKFPRATLPVMVFKNRRDAERVMEVLPKRFGKYGLTLHPKKTKLVEFHRPRWQVGAKRPEGEEQPGTYDFLGFTHYWGRSRYGKWVIKRKTASGRFTKAKRSVSKLCKTTRHLKLRKQHEKLSIKLRGHYQYYGITGNGEALTRFWHEVRKMWMKWLSRRGQRKRRKGGWEWFLKMEEHYRLPRPKVVHSVYGKTLNLFSHLANPWP